MDITCNAFGEQFSKGYLLTEYPLFIKYQSTTMPTADKNWFSPSAVLYSSKDGNAVSPGGDEEANEYVEYCVTRSDSYGIKENAEKYQYESQHLEKWGSWENWLAKNKEGVECTIMAVRCGKWALVRMENHDVIVSSITTLPVGGEKDVYLAVTGEYCSMSNFTEQHELDPVEEAAIRPVEMKKPVVHAKEGDLPNQDCFGWWTAHSDGIEITEKPVTITFDSISYPEAKESWHAPLIVLFSSFDKLVNGVLYKEYGVIRCDNYAWKDAAYSLSVDGSQTDEWGDWSKWLEANKTGVECRISAVRDVDSVKISMYNHGSVVEATVGIPMGETLPVCLSLSGELCYLSNIRISK